MLTPQETPEFLQRIQIITHNLETIILEGNPLELDLPWQLGQMVTAVENWADRLDPDWTGRPRNEEEE